MTAESTDPKTKKYLQRVPTWYFSFSSNVVQFTYHPVSLCCDFITWFYYLRGKKWQDYHLGLSLMVLVCGAKPSSLKVFNVSVTLSNASHASDMAPLLMKDPEMEKRANQHTRLHLTALHAYVHHCSHLLCVQRNISTEQDNFKTVLLLQLGRCFALEDYIFWDETNKWVGWNLSNKMEWNVTGYAIPSYGNTSSYLL